MPPCRRGAARVRPPERAAAATSSPAVTRWRLRRARAVLLDGGVVAYPTEGVFGLGCDPRSEQAVGRVLRLKGRAADKGLILIASSLEQVMEYAEPLDQAHMAPVLATWPGPVSWVLPARGNVSPLITGGRASVAVRVTDHPDAASLCDCFGGALVSTSANLSGARPARSALRVRLQFGRRVDYVLTGRIGRGLGACELRDAVSGRVLRAAGAVL